MAWTYYRCPSCEGHCSEMKETLAGHPRPPRNRGDKWRQMRLDIYVLECPCGWSGRWWDMDEVQHEATPTPSKDVERTARAEQLLLEAVKRTEAVARKAGLSSEELRAVLSAQRRRSDEDNETKLDNDDRGGNRIDV